MGSNLEQNDPLKPKSGTANDRDVTIAHLLAASGFASAPDKAATVAYSPTSNISDYFFKSTNDASNVMPLKATDSIRAAESVSISTAPPLIRSAITANLLSPEPTMIKALVAPQDPTYRNLTQTDVPPPRPVTSQPDVPVLRMLKETAAVPVATQSGDAAASGLAPAARPEIQSRQDAPPVVNPTPLKVIEAPVAQPNNNNNNNNNNNGDIKPAAAAVLSPATVFTAGRNDNPLTVASTPRVTSDGPVVTPPQAVRNADGSPIVSTPQTVRNGDGSPIVSTPQVVRNGDGSPIVSTPQVVRNGDGSTIVSTPQIVRNGDGSPIVSAPQVRNDGQIPVAPMPRATNDGPVVTTTQVARNDNPLTVPPGQRNTNDGPIVSTTPFRSDNQTIAAPLSTAARNDVTPLNTTTPLAGAPVRNDGGTFNAAIQNRNDGTPINQSPVRGETPTFSPTPATARFETPNTVARDATPTRDAPQPLPTALPLTNIMAQMSQTGGISPDTVVRVAAANDRFSKENYLATPSPTPTSDRQSPLPSNMVPPPTSDRGQPLPVAQRPDSPTLSTSDGPQRIAPTPERQGTPIITTDNRSDTSRPGSPLPGTVSERPSSSGIPDTTSRPTTSIDPTTGKVILAGVDNTPRPGVDNTRPGNDNSRPSVDNTRPGIDNSRPSVDNTRPGIDNSRPGVDNTRPGIDNSRPGVPDPTRPDVLPRTLPDGRVPDGRTQDIPRTTPDGRLPDGRTQDIPRTAPDGRLPDGRTQDIPRTAPDGRLPDGRTQDIPRTTPDGRVPDGRTQDIPRSTPDGRPMDGVRPGQDPRQQDAARIGPDGRPVENPRTGPDGRPIENPRTGADGRTVESPRTGADSRPQDGRIAPDGRVQDAPKSEFRPQDPAKNSPEGRPQDSQRPNLDGRPQDGPRTTDGIGKVEPSRNFNQEGITRPDQKNAEVPKGELGRSGATEGRTSDGRAVQDGSSKNPDGSGIRAQEPGRINDGLNTRAVEQSGRNPEGVRNVEQNVSSKQFDGTQIRNPEAASTIRSENQAGKLETRSDSASNRTASDSIPQSASTRPGEVRADNIGSRSEQRQESVANRTGEPRPENIANRTGEPRPENIANRPGEPRSENIANRPGEPRPENIANRTGEPRPENIANRSAEPRLDNANKPVDSAAISKNIENVPTRSTEPSKAVELPGTKPGEVRTDVAANRPNEAAIIKNTEASNVRGDIQPNRTTDAVPIKVDGVANRSNDVPNTRPTDANSDAKLVDNSIKQTNSSNVRVDGAKMPDGGDVIKPTDRVSLNTDAPRQPQIEVPLNLVATRKEADAIRQVLIELKQNQHLSSSEVLELPSFKEALRLLDALKPKDGEASADGKPHFSTSFVEAMRLSDFLKVLEKANEVEQKRIHKQQWAARSLSQNQHRVRYLVPKDETLESIAEKVLGDIRFVQLLVTINRAEIIFTCVSGKSVSTVYEGQYLWIPTPNEVAIHRKHYFNANSAASRGEPLAPEAETPIMVEEYEAPTTVRDFATRLRSVTAPPVGAHGESANSPMAVVLYRLRFAGNRNSVNLDEVVETTAEDRRRHKVRLGETLQSIAVNDELMKDVNMWVLICRVNDLDTTVDVVGRPRVQLTRGDIITLPNQADIEEFKLLARLMEIAELSGKKIDIDLNRKPAPAKASPLCKVDRKMSIETLSERCRMILTDNDDTSYSIKLQRDTHEGKWITVASYESKGGKTLRWTYKIDGSKNCLEVGLPAAVSREMAIEDFQRNWRFYYNRYTTVKTDTLELLDMSEAANH